MAGWNRTWRRRLLKLKAFSKNYRVRSRADLLRLVAFLGFFGLLGAFLIGSLLFAWYAKDLPRPDRVVRREGFSTKIYDREEELLYDVFADQRRTPVTLDQVPDILEKATVAIEDKNFYKHGGFDPTGYVRAVFNTIFRGRLQGGSTLTQQLVKNVLLTPQRTIGRKIKEFVLAVQIENKYSKDEILQMYLNEAPYGGTAWGVEAAAETYFGKKVAELNLIESAVLAGLPQSPSRYSPFIGGDAYKTRTLDVLRRMREDGYITRDQEETAVKDLEAVEFIPEGASFKAPHFVLYVKQQLIERYGERLVEQGGLKVTTTLDWDLQSQAQEIVGSEIARVESIDITNGAAMAMDTTTGEILAMVGSKNYEAEDYDGKVNVTLSLRQPGSAIKPVNYSVALESGFTAATVIQDSPVTYDIPGSKPYSPVNYDGKWHGPVTVRQALANSYNVPAVKILASYGVDKMIAQGQKLGITTWNQPERYGLSLTLGGAEVKMTDMAVIYGTLANLGEKVSLKPILTVSDAQDKLLKNFSRFPEVVLDPKIAYLLTDILSNPVDRAQAFGTRSYLNVPGHQVAVKTGTTNDKRDNWT
ncbi:TPA: hypothetical protein DIU13_03185, partial [Candidatus Beckwithbacteria bacterium]|nr:hypothetical protein [Candidatus Beckwithbacteria bacterium]